MAENDMLQRLLEGAQRIKLPGGVVGKVSTVLAVALLALKPSLALAKHLRSHLLDTRRRVIIDQITRASIDGRRDAIGDCVLA